MGGTNRFDDVGQERLERRADFLIDLFQLGVGGGALAVGVADEEIQPRAVLGVGLFLARQQVIQKHVPIAGASGGVTQFTQAFAAFAMHLSRQARLENAQGGIGAARANAQLMDVFDIAIRLQGSAGQIVLDHLQADKKDVPRRLL